MFQKYLQNFPALNFSITYGAMIFNAVCYVAQRPLSDELHGLNYGKNMKSEKIAFSEMRVSGRF